MAALGASLGVANIVLSWRLFGTGREGDLWMMVMAIAQALAILSQLGVEQVAVFSARARQAGADQGRRFDRDSLQWSLLFGLLFAVVMALMLQAVAAAFAAGFDAPTRDRLVALLLPIMLQLAAAPPLYVLRQQLLLDNRAAWSVVLSHVFTAVQCLVLLVCLFCQTTDAELLAWLLGVGSMAGALLAVAGFGPAALRWQAPCWRSLAPLVRASASMRLTHSAHNLLVIVLTNAALSGGAPGTVAVFHYAKRLVDGLASVTISPHMAVLHARQVTAWTRRDGAAFRDNAIRYVCCALPLLMGASSLVLLIGWGWGTWSGDARLRPGSDEYGLLLLLLAWQLVMAIETVAAGVPAYENRAGWLLAVNGLYIASFFLAVHILLPQPVTGAAVAAWSLACQLLSCGLFSWLAWHLCRQHFLQQHRA